MADQLYLSLRLRGYTESNMLRHFEKVLSVFPFSRLSHAGSLLRVWAVASTEPPLIEKAFESPVDVPAIVGAAREFHAADCAAELETAWDIWQFPGEWKLLPARVSLSCFGTRFEDEQDDHIRISFGVDSLFLPVAGAPNALRMSRSNLKSLLHFSSELSRAVTVERQRLWTESGENFAERLQDALAASED